MVLTPCMAVRCAPPATLLAREPQKTFFTFPLALRSFHLLQVSSCLLCKSRNEELRSTPSQLMLLLLYEGDYVLVEVLQDLGSME